MRVALAVSLFAALALPSRGDAQGSALDSLPWRHIGPASFGGRVDDIEAVASKPSVIYVGSAGGGVFKSVNNGTTWESIFDHAGGSISIGDIAIAPSDENIVWVGTGEANSRQSSTWGDGVYRSIDGGARWSFVGLRESHHIGRIAIHPRDPNVVFVAAMGHLWGPNPERGIFRTRDGGKTWEHSLKVDDLTGAVDVALDPDGRTVYAATYQRLRRGFGFVGGGEGSALWRSLDGGERWERLTTGLPSGVTGRIGIALAPSAASTVYAIIEHQNGGIFRSDDRGTTWRRTNSLNPRPMYYSNIRVDPTHPDKVWLLGSLLHLSTDGGKTFSTERTGDRIHVDHHAMWIDPSDGDHLMLGNDGGVYFSYDGARHWDFVDNLPIAQYYDIDVDSRDPYFIYGGTQDNGTWAIPVRTFAHVGITNADVVNIAYGDGFYTVPDPADSFYVYANSQSGRAYRVHVASREERGIRPVPNDAKEEYRFNWSTPMHRSPHDAKTVYYGGNKLFRTRDGGTSWEEVSPDLSRRLEWKRLPIGGMPRDSTTLSRDDGVSDYGTITSISESPLAAGQILVGTDDGKVQLTTNGGGAWSDLTTRFSLPGPRWVSRVLWSRHDARVAWVAFDGHADDDFAPYLFRTSDGGATWSRASGDLPNGAVLKSLEEHPRNRNVLFAGSEFGLFISFDGARRWTRPAGTLPRVRIDDIVVHPTTGDLVLGTHGRSIIVLDDIALFDNGDPSVASTGLTLFPMRRAVQRYMQRILPTPGAKEFAAPNPPDGALITYAIKVTDTPTSVSGGAATSAGGASRSAAGSRQSVASRGGGTAGTGGTARTADTALIAREPGDTVPNATPRAMSTVASGKEADSARVTITAADGRVVRRLAGPATRGIHRIAWDLRYERAAGVTDEDEGWFGTPRGSWVLPGRYTVAIEAKGRRAEQAVEVTSDPRLQQVTADLGARHSAAVRLTALQRHFHDGSRLWRAMHDERRRIDTSLKERAALRDSLAPLLQSVTQQLDSLGSRFRAGFGGPKFSFLDLDGALQASSTAPTAAQARTIEQLAVRLTADLTALNALLAGPFADLLRRTTSVGVTALRPVDVPR